ncbi:MAG: hypothetical protein ACSLEN_00885 [Candidatus Malihini olakiniferum]
MAIGLTTYAFFWRMSSRVPDPMVPEAMLDHTAEFGTTVFQIYDDTPAELLSSAELEKLRQRADDLSIQLELGTCELETAHSRKATIRCISVKIRRARRSRLLQSGVS